MRRANRKLLFKFSGLLYGLVLTFFSLCITGGGHGTYSVCCLFISAWLRWNAIRRYRRPSVWLAVGLLAVNANHQLPKVLFLVTLVFHYVAIPFLLKSPDYDDWEYFSKSIKNIPGATIITAGFLIYLMGQAQLWKAFVASTRPEKV
jgi:hypothetical protein